VVRSQPRQIVLESFSQKPFTKIGLVEWLKVKALSSSPSTTKKKKKTNFEVQALVAYACNPSYLGG
jgi:hypothetical protein